MSTNHEQTITTARLSTAIFPADFHQRRDERDEFTSGQMRHVVHALMGLKVAVTTSEHGQVYINVELRKVRKTPGYGTHEVLISDPYAPERGTWVPLSHVKVVIPLTAHEVGRSPKWDALRTYREEASLATAKLAAELKDTPCNYGARKATVHADFVDVTYTPQNTEPGNVPESRRYTLAELYR